VHWHWPARTTVEWDVGIIRLFAGNAFVKLVAQQCIEVEKPRDSRNPRSTSAASLHSSERLYRSVTPTVWVTGSTWKVGLCTARQTNAGFLLPLHRHRTAVTNWLQQLAKPVGQGRPCMDVGVLLGQGIGSSTSEFLLPVLHQMTWGRYSHMRWTVKFRVGTCTELRCCGEKVFRMLWTVVLLKCLSFWLHTLTLVILSLMPS
jgi:hypothetical protein